MKHNNPTIAQNALRLFNFKTGDSLLEVEDRIIPVIPIVSIVEECSTGTCTDATSATVLTTPTDKDLYITSACMSAYASAAATATQFALSCTINGQASRRILIINKPTLTAGSWQTQNSFPTPVKPDRGTAVVITSNTNNTLFSIQASIQGYYVETVKGV